MTNLSLITLTELSDYSILYDFCQQAFLEKSQPAHINMWDDNWEDKTNTLPYLLLKKDRFKLANGEFHFLIDNNKIVACSGIYKSEFCSNFGIAGVRAWVNKEYRNSQVIRNLLLPVQKKWAQDNNLKAVGLSFNEYNKNIISTWKRIRLGEQRSAREPHHLFYNNFNEVEYPVNVQHTKQWIVYETLDHSFSYDWNLIKY
jgi:hypothetical protein